ncbi:MAG: hypothetical protein ABH950_09770 [Candidatus Altiarchaeota archaeon]
MKTLEAETEIIEESLEDPIEEPSNQPVKEPVEEPIPESSQKPVVPPVNPKKKKSGSGFGTLIIVLILIGIILYIGHYMATQVRNDPKTSCHIGIGPLNDIQNLENPILCYAGYTKSGGTVELDPLESELRKNI